MLESLIWRREDVLKKSPHSHSKDQMGLHGIANYIHLLSLIKQVHRKFVNWSGPVPILSIQ